MKGLILAAGIGSRLRPVTALVPKPLLPIANKPTIMYSIDALREAGIEDICIVVGHHAQQLEDALAGAVSFAHQPSPEGLAHAVWFGREFIANEPFVLLLGDTIHDMDLRTLRDRFESEDADCLALVAPVDNPSRYGIAVVDGDRITSLEEKPDRPRSNLAMAGSYVFGSRLWNVLPNLRPSARGELEITDAIQMLVDGGGKVLAEQFSGWWHDTGTLDTLLAANEYWMRKKGVTGVLLGEGAELDGATARDFTAVGAEARISNGTVRGSIVLPGVRLNLNGGTLRGSLVGADTELAPGAVVERKILA